MGILLKYTPSLRALSTSVQSFFRHCLSQYVKSSASRSFFSFITVVLIEAFQIFCLNVCWTVLLLDLSSCLPCGIRSGVEYRWGNRACFSHLEQSEQKFQTLPSSHPQRFHWQLQGGWTALDSSSDFNAQLLQSSSLVWGSADSSHPPSHWPSSSGDLSLWCFL